MRKPTHAFVMSMGFAASMWLAGCQTSGGHIKIVSSDKSSTAVAKSCDCKNGDCADGKCADNKCANGTCQASEKTEKTAKSSPLARLASRKLVASNVPAASCASGSCDKGTADIVQASSKQSASTCNCDTKMASVANSPPTAPAIASLPAVPHHENVVTVSSTTTIPSAPQPTIVTTVDAVPPRAIPAQSSYGVGVEAISTTAPMTTSTSVPGETSVKDNVMTVRFGQANDYQIIVGQVYQFRRSWKLRFAAVESEDKYGGSVTLIGENLEHLRDGQMVRVEGTVLPSDDRVGGARYQVNRVEVIEPNFK